MAASGTIMALVCSQASLPLCRAVLPDNSLAGRNYVLALFDTDPVADIDRLSRLEEGQLSRVKQVGAGAKGQGRACL